MSFWDGINTPVRSALSDFNFQQFFFLFPVCSLLLLHFLRLMLELFELLLVEWIGNVLTVCIMYTLSLVFFDKVDWMTDRVAVLEGSYRVMYELESMLRWIKGKNCKLKNNLFAVNANVLFLLFWTMLAILNNAHNPRSDAQLFTWQLNGYETVENIKIHYAKLHGSTFFVRTKCFGKKPN